MSWYYLYGRIEFWIYIFLSLLHIVIIEHRIKEDNLSHYYQNKTAVNMNLEYIVLLKVKGARGIMPPKNAGCEDAV